MSRWLVATGALLATAVAAMPAVAKPQARCEARQRGDRVLVDVVELTGFFDEERLRLVRLGLEGRLAIDVKLVRPRKLWFDDQVVSIPLELRLGWNKEKRRYVVDRRRAVDPARLAVGPVALPAVGAGGGPFRVEIRAKLEVVTANSLGRVASWIAGGKKKTSDDSVVTRNVLTTLTQDLAREARASCKANRG